MPELRDLIPAQTRRSIREGVRRRLKLQAGYEWHGAPSITLQRFTFVVNDRELVVEADYRTPVYETILEIVDYDCYQLGLLPHPPAGACIVDIGANIGISTLVFHERFGLPVYAFEPMPDNVSRLRANLAANGLGAELVRPCAVGARSGMIEADVKWEASVSARVGAHIEIAPGSPTQRVEMLSVAEMLSSIPEEIFLMKLDCEGAEFEIVEQFHHRIRSRVANLTFEVHDLDTHHDLATITSDLRRLGYATITKDEMRGRPTMNHLLAFQA